MKEEITKRFEELVEEGEKFSGNIPRGWSSISSEFISRSQAWLSSCANLIEIVFPKCARYVIDINNILNDKRLNEGHIIDCNAMRRTYGIVKSAHGEWEKGFARKIDYILAAETFDDFLDHADTYHKRDRKIESSVLASAVLEDTIKKIALKNNVTAKKSLEDTINELVKADVFNPVKSKRVKAYVGTRNRAFHAKWDEFDIKDVGEMIKGVHELIEDFL